jgi:hypothetical protein
MSNRTTCFATKAKHITSHRSRVADKSLESYPAAYVPAFWYIDLVFGGGETPHPVHLKVDGSAIIQGPYRLELPLSLSWGIYQAVADYAQ